jgi:NADPH:quinone reductase-like Zn-dependent oxidoreductase
MLQAIGTSLTGSKKAKFSFTGMVPVKQRLAYLEELKELMQSGKIKTVLSKIYSLTEIGQAHTYVETGHKKGNVVISLA